MIRQWCRQNRTPRVAVNEATGRLKFTRPSTMLSSTELALATAAATVAIGIWGMVATVVGAVVTGVCSRGAMVE